MSTSDPPSWSGEPAEFDDYAAEYEGGLDNPIKRMVGSSADQFIGVKTLTGVTGGTATADAAGVIVRLAAKATTLSASL